MIIIFLGPPGAGKGTQVKRLSPKLGLSVISIGQLLREAFENQTPEGMEAFKNYIRLGLNVPIGLKFKILAKQMDLAKGGFILDNFPRTEEDLDALKKYLREKNKKIDRVFHLSISDEVALRRITERKEREEAERVIRSDDNPEIIKTRIEEGYRKDLPVILDYFRRLNVLEEINGEMGKEDVYREVLRRLGTRD